ncbi:thioredoxin [Novosphingobium taihuense]|uniref:Thioredoxin n=1 Tax=Novosphingobium taihuense TaxID=260085 RepID=A0A7W7A7K9_9SPHN|nr:thioredoxin [Novosphingobium taihuense]MBB4611919.1 thioredoxin 1 [Novosphingobium taihuense]TWH88727.1 thioredoxin [Novosphingobium taihuense]
MSKLKDVTTAEFETEVLCSPIPVLVDFHAVWCGPCKASAPALEDAAREFEGEIAFVKVDVDQEAEIAEAYDVQGVPTFILIKDGQPVERFQGLVSRGKLAGVLEQFVGDGK